MFPPRRGSYRLRVGYPSPMQTRKKTAQSTESRIKAEGSGDSRRSPRCGGAASPSHHPVEETPEHDLQHAGVPKTLKDQIVVPVEASGGAHDGKEAVRDGELGERVEVSRGQPLGESSEPHPDPKLEAEPRPPHL